MLLLAITDCTKLSGKGRQQVWLQVRGTGPGPGTGPWVHTRVPGTGRSREPDHSLHSAGCICIASPARGGLGRVWRGHSGTVFVTQRNAHRARAHNSL